MGLPSFIWIKLKIWCHLTFNAVHFFQVVWHSMQDEFIKQYKYFESRIAMCYRDSGITFEFTIEDLLGYFSDIAQSH